MGDERETKIGEGHAAAMGRQGLRELRGALYTDSNVAQQPEYGLYGTRTPGEVAEARRGDEREMDEEISSGSRVQDRLNQMEKETDVHGNREGDREQQRERELEMER